VRRRGYEYGSEAEFQSATTRHNRRAIDARSGPKQWIPAHVAKAAASVDVLSGGRLLLGVASGDRPEEYPALYLPFADRGERFRDSFDYDATPRRQYPARLLPGRHR